MLVNSVVLSALAVLAAAQFPPKPEGVKIVKSKLHEDVSISYKEPGLCETTPGVKSYAGHVHLPPGLVDGQDYPINTFFWFFEARHDPENAPLAIWHNGGPGSSSMIGLLQEHGPCFIAEDSKTTIHNPWSWNNHVNMLYIDQPNQVGFSYDIPTNVTVTKEGWKPADFSDGVPATNATFHVGTSSTGKRSNAVTRTEEAAHVAWHFAQTFFSEFPHYKPHDDRISIWAESYGGHYGPGFTRFFQKQNEKIAKGELDDKTARPLHLDTLGIVNGCVDTVSRQESAIKMPYKNTYDLQIYNQSYYEDLMHEYHKEGGCRDQLIQCQKELKKAKKLAKGDMFVATAEDKVEYCSLSKRCSEIGENAYEASDNGRFDIAHPKKDPFPPPHMYGWLTQESVLAALGTPVNFTQHSEAVSTNFDHSGDQIIGFVDAIGYVLDHGIKVAMVYGDRDWACNWIGGETVSLEVPYSRADDFSKAGYEDVHTVDGFSGLTRQFGNFSFTRVFQAGHEVPMYVPGAAYDIFMRAMFNKDIATGKKDVHDDYASKGPADTWHVKQAPPERPETKCYVLAPEGCTEEEWAKVEAGKAIIKDFFVVGFTDDEDVPGDDEL